MTNTVEWLHLAKPVKFEHFFENGYGTLTIRGSEVLAESVEFLPKLYSAFKHAIEERYNLNICGNFYKVNDAEIKCTFILSIAYAENHSINKTLYIQKFEDTFEFWIIGFKAILRSILFDIEHADKHTEETQEEIRKRIFTKKTAALKLYISMYDEDSQNEIQKLRAERKAKRARIKAAARAKALNVAQQNPNHKD